MEALIFGGPSCELRLIAARLDEDRIVAGVNFERDGYMDGQFAATFAPVFAARMGVAATAPPAAEIWRASREKGIPTSTEVVREI